MKSRAQAKTATTKSRSKKLALKPGRPEAQDGVERRQLLLNTALTLFANTGIAGTSLHDIAEKAGVTPALLHYYFGNKEQLVEVVLTECLMPVVSQFNQILDTSTADPLTTLIHATRQMIELTQLVPWLPNLWVREVLNEDGYLRGWAQEHVATQQSERIRQLASAAQQQGLLNPKLDTRLIIVAMVGLTLFPLAGASMWKNLPGNENISTEVLTHHMLELLTHGISAKTSGAKHAPDIT